MTAGILDKLGINEKNAAEWLSSFDGDPERHLLHAVDAIIGFLGNPQQEFSAKEISKFLTYLQHALQEDNCTIDVPHLAELYKQVQDNCEREAEAWKKLQLKADEDGLGSVNEAFVQELWKTMPDNQGQQYVLRKLAFCASECRNSALWSAIFAANFEIIVPSCQEITIY